MELPVPPQALITVDTSEVTPATAGARQRDSRLAAMMLVCGLHLMLYAAFRYAFTRTRPESPPSKPALLYLWVSSVRDSPAARSAAAPSPRHGELVPSPARTPASRTEEHAPADGARVSAITIDWAAETARSAAAIAASSESDPGHARFRRRAPESPRRHARSFEWDTTVTERIEPIPGGGTLIKLNDHCGLAFTPLPMLGCWLGHREANAHLFDGMGTTTRQDAP